MSHDADHLLEVDRIEEVLEAADPPQPVVVIQYPTKKTSRYWPIALIVLIPFGGMAIYHQREVQRLRSQALSAKRDFESWKERFHIEAAREEIIPAARSGSTSSTSQTAVPPLVNTEPTHQQVSATSKPSAGTESPVATPAGALEPTPALLASTDAGTAPARGPRSPIEIMGRESVEPAGPSVEAGALQTPAIARSPTASPTPTGVSDASARSPAKAPESSPTPSVAPPDTPVTVPAEPPLPSAAPAEPPLPSKEETLRAIQEEALRKQEEIRHQVEDKAVEIHRLRYEERLRFHKELREALDQYGRRAGAAIDQLCVRFGYEADEDRLRRGSLIWSWSGKPLTYRVARIRALDLPETAILNFLSDDLHARVRTRDGPRDSNEVRVRAALLLLNNCGLPSFEEASRLSAIGAGSGPAANPRVGNPSTKAAPVVRPR